MKAVVCRRYGSPDVLEITDMEKPIPKAGEVLVKVYASSLNFGNLVLLKGEPFLARFAFGLTKPKFMIPGGDLAGTVEAVGKDVKQFKVGDEVYGDLATSGWGAFAEYAAVPESALTGKPVNLTFEEAAAVPMAGVTALQALRDKAQIKSGQKVLIHGASGGVGSFAVQLAKAFGAEVTALCSTRNIDIVKTIGADHTIDYTKEDFTTGPHKFDLILGVNGHQPLSSYKNALNPDGIFVHVGGSESQMYQTMLQGPFLSLAGKKKFKSFLQRPNEKDLMQLRELIEAGKVKPVIDRCFHIGNISDAYKYFAEGHAQGKVVITF